MLTHIPTVEDTPKTHKNAYLHGFPRQPGHRVPGSARIPQASNKKNTPFFVLNWIKNSRVTKQEEFSDEFLRSLFFAAIFFFLINAGLTIKLKESLTCLELNSKKIRLEFLQKSTKPTPGSSIK